MSNERVEKAVKLCFDEFEPDFGKIVLSLVVEARGQLRANCMITESAVDIPGYGLGCFTVYENYRLEEVSSDSDPIAWNWNYGRERGSVSLSINEPFLGGRLNIRFDTTRNTKPTIVINDLQLALGADHWITRLIPGGVVSDFLAQKDWTPPPPLMKIVYHRAEPLQREFNVIGARMHGSESLAKKISYGNF